MSRVINVSQFTKCSQLLLAATLGTSLALVAPHSVAKNKMQLNIGVPIGLPGHELGADKRLKISDPRMKRFIKCVESSMNANFAWQARPTKGIIQSLQACEIDMIYPMGFTDERAATMLQSDVTAQMPDILVSMKPINLQDKSIRIGARLGSPQETEYASKGYAHITAAYAYEDLPKMLARDMVEVAIVPAMVYSEQKNKWPVEAIVSTGTPRSLGFYLTKGDPKGLLTNLNKGIAQCKEVEVAL